jgi:hypothetical protein
VLRHVAAGPFTYVGLRKTGEEHGLGQDLGLFKDADGKGYLVYDDGHRNIRVDGWKTTETTYAVADKPLGPYKEMGFMSEEKTWNSQMSNFFYLPETDKVLAMCDQWFVGHAPRSTTPPSYGCQCLSTPPAAWRSQSL